MNNTIFCKNTKETLKEICLGGEVISEYCSFNERAEGLVTCFFLEIRPVSPLAVRGAYRTEREAANYLTSYLSNLAEKHGMPYWTWDFHADILVRLSRGETPYSDPENVTYLKASE